MQPGGELTQPKRRRKTSDIGNGNGNGSKGSSPLIYPVSGDKAAPETDDSFADPQTEEVETEMYDDATIDEPSRLPPSSIRLHPLPGSTRVSGATGAAGIGGIPTSAIPPRRTGQHGHPTTTTGLHTPTIRGSGMGPRSSRLRPEPEDQPHRNVHWLLPLGVGMVAMLLLWVVGSSVLAWGLDRYDDLRYGYPRTYQTDAVVGHGDSKEHQSHFMAINLHGQAIVIEFPAGNPQYAVSYVVPYYIREQGGGQGGDRTPVTVEFRDVTGDSKPDMIIHILFRTQDQTFVFVNTGTKFRPPTSSDNIHL